MKTTKEKADNLIEQYWTEVEELKQFDNTFDIIKMTRVMAIQCAILSVKHTIEVLEKAKQKAITESEEKYFNTLINEQTELLTELESRL